MICENKNKKKKLKLFMCTLWKISENSFTFHAQGTLKNKLTKKIILLV